MTPELKQWADGISAECFNTFDHREQARFWISAFVRLVREESDKVRLWNCGCDTCCGEAFNALCAKFGLEEK